MAVCWLSTAALAAKPPGHTIEIHSVVVDGRPLVLKPGKRIQISSYAKSFTVRFGPSPGESGSSSRYRCQLEGFENTWHEGNGFMFLGVRFFNAAGDQIDQVNFPVTGESPGWSGTLRRAALTHRRETLLVPTNAARASIVISSAGPPSTEGIYVLANLVISEYSGDSASTVLIQSTLDQPAKTNLPPNQAPADWIRDGTHASMAKIVSIGQDLPVRAFAIEDNDTFAHAEWRLLWSSAPLVTPGDHLVVEWNEMYSIGDGNNGGMTYQQLKPGNYRFRMIGVGLLGNPDGPEADLDIYVPRPFWQQPWFWAVVILILAGAGLGSGRYLLSRRMKKEMMRLKNLQALEQERLRIAHDIHDDLGARVTQISMVSAMSLHDPTLSEKTREDLNQIKHMSRDLVTALYETVWAVTPEYDNLDALGSYLCQMVNQQCDRTSVHCRLNVSELPHEIQISSQTRHNIAMAVKEAVNNAIKHAKVTEVVMTLTWNNQLLEIGIADNGRGFDANNGHGGHGLNNMKQRMKSVGGACVIESKPGAGTLVHLSILIKQISN